jgi:hypothetical protein
MARIITFTASGGLPSYLSGASAWQWVAVASPTGGYGTGGTLTAKMPGLVPDGDGNVDAWCGAVVDETRGELIRCSNGGHNDYYGNETYALALRVASPTWTRLTTPSPTSTGAATRSYPVSPNWDAYPDGNPAATHSGSEVQFHSGRVWFTYQTSTAGGSAEFNGNWSIQSAYSWDRASVSGSTPIATPGTFRQHGYTELSAAGFGCSALISSLSRVYCFRGAFNSYQNYYTINTATGVSESARISASISTGGVPIWPVWAAGCDALGIVITGSAPIGANNAPVHVLNASTGVWTNPTNGLSQSFVWAPLLPSTAGQFVPATQPVYLQQGNNHYLLFYSPGQTDQSFIRTLKIPTTANVYNPSGAWVWGSQSVTGLSVTALMSYLSRPYLSGLFGRFNVIRDIGNTEPVLVCQPSQSDSTYVCRLETLT